MMEDDGARRLPAGGQSDAQRSPLMHGSEHGLRPRWDDEPMEGGAQACLPAGGQDEAPSPLAEPTTAARRVEHLDTQQQDQENYAAPQDQLGPPMPRTQMDQSGEIPRPGWDDGYRDELYAEILPTADLQYRLFPPVSRPLPGSNHEPTGLIDRENYKVGDTYATDEHSWILEYAQAHQSQMVDYDRLEEWLSVHLPTPGRLDTIVIFTDTRPLDQISAWHHTEPLWQHRFSRQGPHLERWQGLFVPLTAQTGLQDVHCPWGGVFVAEAIAALRPTWNILLSDTDVAHCPL